MSDRFYITLDENDQEIVRTCLASGKFDNAGDLIRKSIALAHRQISQSIKLNQKLRDGVNGWRDRLKSQVNVDRETQ